MIRRIILLLTIFAGALIFLSSSVITDSYLSPEHMCFSEERREIYVAYATSPGIGVIHADSSCLNEVISLPSPVSGLCTLGNLLFASLNADSRIVAYDLTKKRIKKTIRVGYGPGDMAAYKDQWLFVANRFSNDVSVIDLSDFSEFKRIKVGREPSALAVSPSGDVLYVANTLPESSAMDDYISAKVTLIDTDNFEVIRNIELPNGSNSLKDIIFSGDEAYVYVTHLVGRYNLPTNQIEKGWINTNAISVINAKTQQWYTTVLLDDIYRGAANPCGLEISKDGRWLYVAVSGTHELFRIDREEMHRRIEKAKSSSKDRQSTSLINEPESDFPLPIFKPTGKIEPMGVQFDNIPNELGFLTPFRTRIPLEGKGPRHLLAVPSGDGEKIYVSSYFSDGLDVLDFSSNGFDRSFVSLGSGNPEKDPVRYGALLFHDATNCFQQWQSCASCHPGEGRTDGLNWDLMNDGMGNPKNTKSLLYSHITPPVMISGIRPDAETGVRAGFKYIQFYYVSEEKAVAVDQYLKSLQPLPSPLLVKGKLSDSALRGKEVFEKAACIECHSGPLFTNLMKYEMGSRDKYDKQNTWDTPTLIELWRTAPYMHHGKFYRLEDVFEIGKHGLQNPLSSEEIGDLTDYLLSL